MQTVVTALIAAFVFGVLFALLAGLPIMWLWNMLMPVLFKLPVISFWQAIGLGFLGRLLFGGGSASSSSKK